MQRSVPETIQSVHSPKIWLHTAKTSFFKNVLICREFGVGGSTRNGRGVLVVGVGGVGGGEKIGQVYFCEVYQLTHLQELCESNFT